MTARDPQVPTDATLTDVFGCGDEAVGPRPMVDSGSLGFSPVCFHDVDDLDLFAGGHQQYQQEEQRQELWGHQSTTVTAGHPFATLPTSNASHIARTSYPALVLPQLADAVVAETGTGNTDLLASESSYWFLEPESWRADYCVPPDQAQSTASDVRRNMRGFIEDAQKWHRQWVTEGHCPIHHRELYATRTMPRCIQDAYTATATYHLAKSSASSAPLTDTGRRKAPTPVPEEEGGPKSEPMDKVALILEERVTQLLQDQALRETLVASLDVSDHLDRVQALLAYQIIRLFDGNIYMRGRAEETIPTLHLWNKQLLESAKEQLSCSGVSHVIARQSQEQQQEKNFHHQEQNMPQFPLPSSSASSSLGGLSSFFRNGDDDEDNQIGAGGMSTDALRWHLWVLSESVRRTWQVAAFVQETYNYLKQRWAECPGRLTWTMRQGLWDAPSPYSFWSTARVPAARAISRRHRENGIEKAGAERERREASLTRIGSDMTGALFLHPPSVHAVLFDRTRPSEVDEFSLSLLRCCYGSERMERWRDVMGCEREDTD